jgi:hypothetical protein
MKKYLVSKEYDWIKTSLFICSLFDIHLFLFPYPSHTVIPV